MIIDMHAHIAGPSELHDYFRGFINVCGPVGRGMRVFEFSDERLEVSIQAHLRAMEEAGTDFQLIAANPSAVPTAERRTPLVLGITQQLNDMIARCVRLHPDRFAGIGLLPQSPGLSASDAIGEMQRCVTELGFVGFQLNPDPGEGDWEAPEMGSAFWRPIYEELVELGTPALIHAGQSRFSREPQMGYACQEESVAGWSLLRMSEIWRDLRDLKLVLAHGGGYIPYQFGRARCFRQNEHARGPSSSWEPFEESLQRLYFDTVLFDRDAIELMLKVCGVDHCLFGSGSGRAEDLIIDPLTGKSVHDVKPLVEGITWLGDADRKALFEVNTRRLYPRLSVSTGV